MIKLNCDKCTNPMNPEAPIICKHCTDKLSDELAKIEKESGIKIGDLVDENKELTTKLTLLEKDLKARDNQFEKLNTEYEELYRKYQDLSLKQIFIKNTVSDTSSFSKRLKSQE